MATSKKFLIMKNMYRIQCRNARSLISKGFGNSERWGVFRFDTVVVLLRANQALMGPILNFQQGRSEAERREFRTFTHGDFSY